MNGSRIVLVIANQIPAVSETFVTAEVEKLAGSGRRVYTYSLTKPTLSTAPAAPYLLPPISRKQLLPWLLRAWLNDPFGQFPGLRGTYFRGYLGRLYAAAHALRCASAGIQFEVVHAHFLARTAEVAVRVAERQNVPVVVTVHAADAAVDRSPRADAFMDKINRFRCASKTVERTLRSTYPDAPSTVLPCIVHLPPARNDRPADLRGRPLRVVTVARLVSTKGYREAAEALNKLAKEREIEWHIAGEGPERSYLEELKATARPNLRIKLHGSVAQSDCWALMRHGDVFVLLSETANSSRITRGDGLPIAIAEAMSLGVPVISTAAGAIPELIRDRENGFIVDPRDIDAVVAAVSEASLAIGTELCIAAQRDSRRHFDQDANFAALNSMLEAT